jgi:hypothetical protein
MIARMSPSAWYDATGLPTGPISRLLDKSGNALHLFQPIETLQPIATTIADSGFQHMGDRVLTFPPMASMWRASEGTTRNMRNYLQNQISKILHTSDTGALLSKDVASSYLS